MPALASIHLYPVKSCRGHAVELATLDRFGLATDRRFLAVDASGRFLTQRTLPRLALVEPALTADHLTLAAPGFEPVRVPLRPTAPGPAFEVTIWRDTVSALDLGAAAADWLTRWLGQPARLVTLSAAYHRPVRNSTGPDPDQAAFSDAFPVLVISEASLDELNHRLDTPLPMDRFRPNLVVRDCPAYAEDAWRRIRIGDVVLRAAGPCGRCVVTTTDQQTLERSKEPLRTLAQYRRGAQGEVFFGQNYIHETRSGTLRVGAPIEVLE